MSVYSSDTDALDALFKQLKVFDDVHKDDVACRLRGASPPMARRAQLSRSLEVAEQRLAAPDERKSPGQKKAAQENSSSQTLVRTFDSEAARSGSSFTFEAVAVGGPVRAKSKLGQMLRTMPKPVAVSEGKTRDQKVRVQVFLEGGGVPMRVTVPATATVGELIWSSIEQHQEEKRAPPLVPQTKAHILKMAEKDGSAEEFALRVTDRFLNFGRFFALAPNPEFAKAKEAPARSAGRDTSSSKVLPRRSASLRGKPRKDNPLGGDGSRALIRVKMPDSTHSSVLLDSSATAADVVDKCCSKRGFAPDRYHLESSKDGETILEATLVSELKGLKLELVANSEIAGLDGYLGDHKAMQYETFRVIKIKKGFGGNQERVLGIDPDRITNGAPDDASGSGRSTLRKAFDGVRSGVSKNNSGGPTKRGYWLMGDLVEAAPDAENAKQFVLMFKEAGKTLSYRYEAESPKLAKQILSKLHRLLELYHK